MSSKSNDHTIGIICAIAFLVLTLGIPFTGLLGGFYSQDVSIDYLGTIIDQKNEYMWDGIEETATFIFITMTITVSYNQMATGSQAGALWNIADLWGMIYILLTVLGGGMVTFYAFMKMNGDNPNSLLNIGGVMLGLIGTVGEWAIIAITISIEDWDAMADALGVVGGTVTTPQINLLLLALFVTGWILLIFGSIKAAKPAVLPPKIEPTIADY
ncbi:MAG: hypothetical protein ACXABI_11885 [Candidatus Hodarchaeales archaeon]|jgi:hypothetical protein